MVSQAVKDFEARWARQVRKEKKATPVLKVQKVHRDPSGKRVSPGLQVFRDLLAQSAKRASVKQALLDRLVHKALREK
jgi:hypothetical protein